MNGINMPLWYWSKGLHDAVILDIVKVDVPYDYSQKNPTRNYCSIRLDSTNALFDSSISELRLMNAKILPTSVDFRGWWWVNDSVENLGKKIVLTITVRNYRNVQDLKTIRIQCEDVVVVRNM